MTSQIGNQTNTINILLPDISKSKDNQTMKFGQLIEYNMTIFYIKNHAENDTRRLVPDLFLKKKALYELNASGQHLSFNIFL